MHHRSPIIVALVAGVLALSACAPPADEPATTAPTGDGHGRVAGASEMSEPQLGLTSIDPGGRMHHLDLLDESVAEIGEVPAPRGVTTDGRYLFSESDDGVTVVDSGRWTWDHVDHFHYYRAEPRTLGTVAGTGPATIATTNSSTTGGTGVFFSGSGEAVLLDTEALARGELVERFRLEVEPHDGLVVPVGSFAVVTERTGAEISLTTYSADGEPVPGDGMSCAEARGTITTRVGAVVGCADGAVLVTLDDGEPVLEKIPYPADSSAPAATFAGREGRPTVAALAGPDGIWLLDTRERSWTLLPAPTPLLQVTAVDDEDGHVLALAADGRVLVLDAETGSLLSETAPLLTETLASPDALEGVTLVADQQRAYLNAPLERRLYEIDFADAARIARTFDVESVPAFVAETGR